MNTSDRDMFKRTILVVLLSSVFLFLTMLLGISVGSTTRNWREILDVLGSLTRGNSLASTIIWKIRFPRVTLAALVGSTLSLGGLTFQALLRNPLAEPYILGISGGAAVGAITGILLGLSNFPGVSLLSFVGSMLTLFIVILISSGKNSREDSLLLAGVMVNAFCSSIIIFLVSLTLDARLHSIMFWLMGDLSLSSPGKVFMLLLFLLPCFVTIYSLARPLNLIVMGRETAENLGVNTRLVYLVLVVLVSLMVSAVVCQSGLVGFVGLVIPHLLRLIIGADHRLLIPASIFGGAGYMVLCDVLARVLPSQGEMPVGVITAMIGAPLFIFLLKSSKS